MMLRNFAKAVKGLPYYALEAGTRSGTTVLSRLLDSHPNIVSTGEAFITSDTTLDGDDVKVVVSKEAYISMQPRRQHAATWLDPDSLGLVETGKIILTRSLLESIYSTYKLSQMRKNLDPEQLPPARRARQRSVTDDRQLMMAINGTVQARRELIQTVSESDCVVVDYSDIVADPVATCNRIYEYMGLPLHSSILGESKISTPTRGDRHANSSNQVTQVTVTPLEFKQRVNDLINFDIDVLNETLAIRTSK